MTEFARLSARRVDMLARPISDEITAQAQSGVVFPETKVVLDKEDAKLEETGVVYVAQATDIAATT